MAPTVTISTPRDARFAAKAVAALIATSVLGPTTERGKKREILRRSGWNSSARALFLREAALMP